MSLFLVMFLSLLVLDFISESPNSHPYTKMFYSFQIPLSGYGGTSNVILEDLRKRSDGYVAILSSVQAGRVSKLCVCVRNTGSRAAYVRAVPYTDLEKRIVMESTVISLSPSQFVLKERTQEVSLLTGKFPFLQKTVQSLNRYFVIYCDFYTFCSAVIAGHYSGDEGFK